MAFIPTKLSGLASGSGKAPGIFSYTSPDSIATITTAGYFDGLKGGLVPNDIIYCVALDDSAPVVTILVCVKAEYTPGVGFETDFSTYSTMAGDVRATDTAGLQLSNLSGSLGMAGGDANSTDVLKNVARTFTYRNNTDAILTITASGYFNGAADALVINDLILTVANNDFAYLRVLDIVDGVVTTEAIVFA